MNTKNIVIGLIAAAVLGAGAWFIFFSDGTQFAFNKEENGAEEAEGAVALVNGEEVSRAEYDALAAQVAAEQGFDPATLDAQTQAQFESQVVDTLVSRVLLRQAIEGSGLTASAEEVNAQVEVIKGQFESEAVYLEALSAEGLTEEALRSQIGAELVMQAYLEQALNLSSVSATSAEITAAYEEIAAGENVPPLADVREEVEGVVIQQKRQVLVAELIQELRAEADIQILI